MEMYLLKNFFYYLLIKKYFQQKALHILHIYV